MIIKYAHCDVVYTLRGLPSRSNMRKRSKYEVKCDCCGKIFTEIQEVFEKRLSLINLEYCGKCSRPKMSSLAGLKGTYNEDGSLKPNTGRFSTERVNAMSEDEYNIFCEQRRRASNIHHNRLKNNPDLFAAHYDKVFKNSKIGYISKAQRDIHSILEPHGFELEKVVEGFSVDIVNVDKKIIYEYYGDLFHANPRKYEPDDYIDIIKMTAKQKWEKDRKRNFALRRLGYEVIVIWENKWNNERRQVLESIGEKINVDFSHINIFLYDSGKMKSMYNEELNKNKNILLAEVEEHLKNGWTLKFKLRKEIDEINKNRGIQKTS